MALAKTRSTPKPSATVAIDSAPDRLLTETEVAQRLGWSRKTLQRRRWLQEQPGWIKIGASVRYSERVIDRFIEDGRHLVDDLGVVRSPETQGGAPGRRPEAA
jgi:predicted DNA-binding transcriptional regulator AlpA